jgi:hypothetical protein
MTRKPTSPAISEENPMEIDGDQSVNIDSAGLRIRIPVLKRKREKE